MKIFIAALTVLVALSVIPTALGAIPLASALTWMALVGLLLLSVLILGPITESGPLRRRRHASRRQ